MPVLLEAAGLSQGNEGAGIPRFLGRAGTHATWGVRERLHVLAVLAQGMADPAPAGAGGVLGLTLNSPVFNQLSTVPGTLQASDLSSLLCL